MKDQEEAAIVRLLHFVPIKVRQEPIFITFQKLLFQMYQHCGQNPIIKIEPSYWVFFFLFV